MSDPVVCSFITKILCGKGGRLELQEIPHFLGLSDQQLKGILQEAGEERFLLRQQQGPSPLVLALSPVRLCLKDQCAEGDCGRLHICKNFLKRRCFRPVNGRWACKYSHDVFSESNRQLLKKHELSGLNEDELRVLLLQNDPFLLPVCSLYNKGDGNCSQQENCPKLHVCQYFLKGQCRFSHCKRCHNLLQPNILMQLSAEGVDDTLAWNIQTICDHRNALSRQLGPHKGNASNTGPAVNTETSNTGIQREQRQERASVISGSNHDVRPAPSPKRQNAEKDKTDEICLFYVWRFCKNKSNCNMIHYEMPYRWQIQTANGWKDLPKAEEIEIAYCDPCITRIPDRDINFQSMTSGLSPVRRLSTPSSVTKPAKFVMTTKWLWYWKNEFGQWIEYGKQNGQLQGSDLCSDDLENLFLADPASVVPFKTGSHTYQINFKDMVQTNMRYLTQREVRRRPKFVSSEDVKTKKGHMGNVPACVPRSNYPGTWDKSALPEVGYRAIELSNTSAEYSQIESLFKKTMDNYVVEKIKRIQNPSLWQVFQWQKEQMKKKRGGQNVGEKLLFHGTSMSNVEAICSDNFDWRICGTNGTVYGKGSYFARDAQYSHNYCQRDAKTKVMFVAQVLVGDFIIGNAAYTRPPVRSSNMVSYYDSCVNNTTDPSIFVIFEKHQIYPSYIIYYCEEDKKCVLS